MKILIFGGKGWIGQQFIILLMKNKYKDHSIFLAKSRPENFHDLENEILNVNPSHVVSFVGRTHGTINNKKIKTIDYLEHKDKLKENLRDNLFAPLQLAYLCEQKNIHLTYMGTGCIFKYDSDHQICNLKQGFKEIDIPNFFGSQYSTVKGYTDRIMKLFSKNILNLRIRMPITNKYHERNFITKITNYEYICSLENSMSVLPTLLPIMIDLMDKAYSGTLNFTNPGYITHNQILNHYKEIVDPSFTWKNFTKEKQDEILLSDRSNNYLDTKQLEELYPNIPNIKDAVIECLHDYKLDYLTQAKKPKIIYTPKNLLITGGCGFIGSNFINYFSNKYPDIKIINLDALHYCSNKNNIHSEIRNSKNYEFIKGNINSIDLLDHILNKYQIDSVIHFAAQSHVQNSFTDSIKYTNDNVLGTHNLLEACKIYNKIKKFIHVSTDEVYGESMISKNEIQKNENNILCPTNPYAATKAAAELIAQSYQSSFNFPIVITRGNNVFGENQYPEKLIPKFIKLLKNNQKITIHGDGSSLRSFIHVYDVCTAFDIILSNGVIGEIYNIGSEINMEYSVLDVGKLLIKLIKKTDDFNKWITYVEDRPFNDKRYFINSNKLKELGWKTTQTFKESIKKLIDKENFFT